MDKTKFAILVGLLLALLFFWKMDAEASASHSHDLITTFTVSPTSRTYNFNIGASDVVSVQTVNDDGDIITVDTSYISYSSGQIEINIDTGVFSGSRLSLSDLDFYDYDYLNLRFKPEIEIETIFNNYTGSGYTMSIGHQSVRPYFLYNGQKHYISYPMVANSLMLDIFSTQLQGFFGVEVDMVINYDGSLSSDTIKSLFGNTEVVIDILGFDIDIYGVSYISSGDNSIIVEVQETNSLLTTISGTLSSWKSALTTQLTNWQTALDSKLDEVVEALGQNYDSSGAQSTNTELSGSLDSWEAAEGTTMSDAKIEVSSYDTSSAFDFAPALVSSMTLITTFANGFFRASGDFSTALIVMIALVFVSVVVGLVRFVK